MSARYAPIKAVEPSRATECPNESPAPKSQGRSLCEVGLRYSDRTYTRAGPNPGSASPNAPITAMLPCRATEQPKRSSASASNGVAFGQLPGDEVEYTPRHSHARCLRPWRRRSQQQNRSSRPLGNRDSLGIGNRELVQFLTRIDIEDIRRPGVLAAVIVTRRTDHRILTVYRDGSTEVVERRSSEAVSWRSS